MSDRYFSIFSVNEQINHRCCIREKIHDHETRNMFGAMCVETRNLIGDLSREYADMLERELTKNHEQVRSSRFMTDRQGAMFTVAQVIKRRIDAIAVDNPHFAEDPKIATDVIY